MSRPSAALNCATSSRLLRKHYGDKIDEIAMTFGVQQAMETQDEVERTVVVPRDVKPISRKIEARITPRKIWVFSCGRIHRVRVAAFPHTQKCATLNCEGGAFAFRYILNEPNYLAASEGRGSRAPLA